MLDRQVAAIVWRTFGQERIEAMAAVRRVPVVNALTDEFHPCQVLADLQTVRERWAALAGLTLTYLGDGANNMAHSYLLGGAIAGHARPHRLPGRLPARPADPRPRRARSPRRPAARSRSLARPEGGGRGADVARHRHLGVDGPGGRGRDRDAPFVPYAVDDAALALAAPTRSCCTACPPTAARRSPPRSSTARSSVVWDEAENRLHAQKALLDWLLERSGPSVTAMTPARDDQGRPGTARIVELLQPHAVHSQPELAELLAEDGLAVTQATLSRDLDELGAVKLRDADGALVYAVPAEGGDRTRLAPLDARAPVPGCAGSAGELLVVRRGLGQPRRAAHAAGRRAVPRLRARPRRLADVLGTVAGDDTVLVISRDPDGGSRSPNAARLSRLARDRTVRTSDDRHPQPEHRSKENDQ